MKTIFDSELGEIRLPETEEELNELDPELMIKFNAAHGLKIGKGIDLEEEVKKTAKENKKMKEVLDELLKTLEEE